MGDSSQLSFLRRALHSLPQSIPVGTAVVSGAALQGHSALMVEFLESINYNVVTTDIAHSPGVDIVWDLQTPPPPELQGAVDLFISCSVLEHVKDIAKASSHITQTLSRNGILYVSVPWVWRYHRYPDDYHRFNSSTLEALFGQTRVLDRAWSTSPDCCLYDFDTMIDDRLSVVINGVKYLPYLMIHELRQKD
jgi:hypothetical protein